MTICNQNRVHCKRLDEVVRNCSEEIEIVPKPDLQCERMKNILQMACSENLGDHNINDTLKKSDVPENIDAENRFLYFYMNIAETVRLSIGHQFSDMVSFCTFKGKACPSGLV